MEERYALALALVPEEDVAGDLFMEASDEADLIRRAQRWRSRHGLPPVAGRPPLPALTADQRAHAVHLSRRAALRRRMKPVAAVLLAVILALAGGVLQRPAQTEPTLALDPVYEGASVAISDLEGGSQVLIYKAEATPGAVTLWWAVTGAEAGARVNRLTPELNLNLFAASSTGWTAPLHTEVTVHRSNRVLGKSVYRVFAPVRAEAAYLRLREGDEIRADWSLAVPLERLDANPADRSRFIGREAANGPYIFRLLTLTRGPHHTGIRYLADFAEANPFLAVESHGVLLLPHLNWNARDLGPAEVEALLDPLPPGAERLTVYFSPRGWRPEDTAVKPFAEGQGAGWRVTGWKREGAGVSATVIGDATVVLNAGTIQEMGTTRIGELKVEYLGAEPGGNRHWRISGDEFAATPPEHLWATLRFTRLIPPILQLPLDLNDLK